MVVKSNLQSGVHASRRDHGFPLHYPEYPGSVGELLTTGNARHERRRVPPAKPEQFLPLGHWSNFVLDGSLGDRTRYGLDLLHPVLDRDPTGWGSSGCYFRGLCPRL